MKQRCPPWLDLPAPLTEMVLERLPLSGYVRFAAVCRRWRSAQREHRLRFAPNPPPMLSLPWLVPQYMDTRGSILCHSPFEHASYRLQLPPDVGRLCVASPRGWLLFLRNIYFDPEPHADLSVSLLNPVSGLRIQPPPLNLSPALRANNLTLSASSDPAILIRHERTLWLFRLHDLCWTNMSLPYNLGLSTSAVSCRGKFYFIGWKDNVVVVADPLPDPAVGVYEMDPSQMQRARLHPRQPAEFRGDLLLVGLLYDERSFTDIRGFQLFSADMCSKAWVKMESIGEYMLIYEHSSFAALLAADVGGRRNCVYFSPTAAALPTGEGTTEWKVFELGTGRLTSGTLQYAEAEDDWARPQRFSWFMPTLC